MNITDMINNVEVYGLHESVRASKYPMAVDTNKCTDDLTKMTYSLFSVPTGTGHDNALKGIVVQFDLTMTVKMSVFKRYLPRGTCENAFAKLEKVGSLT